MSEKVLHIPKHPPPQLIFRGHVFHSYPGAVIAMPLDIVIPYENTLNNSVL